LGPLITRLPRDLGPGIFLTPGFVLREEVLHLPIDLGPDEDVFIAGLGIGQLDRLVARLGQG
jgi:hypothetical protein